MAACVYSHTLMEVLLNIAPAHQLTNQKKTETGDFTLFTHCCRRWDLQGQEGV